ncbi:hypothetical protein IT575_01480 [bacterium]|nr:hypothetical protein [bacterium]
MERALISREHRWLLDFGLLALMAAAVYRFSAIAWGHGNWLLPSQIIGICLLLSAAFLAASLLPRFIGDSLLYLLGIGLWAAALSFIPRYGWWPTGSRPAWAYYGALALLAVVLLYCFARRQRWYGRMRGKGWEWIQDWAHDKPYEARKLARRVLRTLGYPDA